MNTEYPITIYTVQEGSGLHWVASYFDLPGCIGVGHTKGDALSEAEINKDIWLETAKAIGKEIPKPSIIFSDEYSGKFNLRIPKCLHKLLAVRAESEGVSLNMLCTCLLSMGVNQEYSSISINRQNATSHTSNNDINSSHGWERVSEKIIPLNAQLKEL